MVYEKLIIFTEKERIVK